MARAGDDQDMSWAEPELRRFRRLDAEERATMEGANNVVLFVGSSIFREWRELRAFDEDWARDGWRVKNRAFGGSTTADVLRAFDDVASSTVASADARKIIVYYCGSNDISMGVPPSVVVGNFVEFTKRCREASRADVGFCFVGVIDSPQKRLFGMSKDVEEVNALAKEFCGTDEKLAFVDVTSVFADANGAAKTELFRDDCTHLKPHAYDAFKAAIEPVVSELAAKIFIDNDDDGVESARDEGAQNVKLEDDFLPPSMRR